MDTQGRIKAVSNISKHDVQGMRINGIKELHKICKIVKRPDHIECKTSVLKNVHPNVHPKLTDLINVSIRNPSHLPMFLLTHGITYLLNKDPENKRHPSKYRTYRTCFPTLYKIIRSYLILLRTAYDV